MGQRKILSPRRELKPWPRVTPVGRSNHWATGRLVAGEVTEFVVTRVMHTARISNVESTVCDNKDRLTAVQSPRRTPVKNLTRHSRTGKLSGTTCPRWIGYELVYFGILHIRNGTSYVSRTLVNDICNICGCKLSLWLSSSFSKRSFSLTLYLT